MISSDATALIDRGIGLLQQGRPEEAIACFEGALAVSPASVRALNHLGMAFHRQKRYEEAVACYEKALDFRPDNANAHINLGNALMELSRFEDALAYYEKAAALRPDLAGVHYNRGLVLQKLSRFDEAAACYEKTLALKPDFAEACNGLGMAHKESGRIDEAIRCYEKALALRPDLAEAHNNLGLALQEQGQVGEALAHCQKAIALRPDLAEAHNNLGLALRSQGRLEEALACYRKALALKPDYAEACNNLGVALYDQGRLEEAVAYYRKTLVLKPGYAMAHNNLGIALQEQGKSDEAVAHLDKALAIDPGYAGAHDNLASALKDQGRLDEAIAHYKEALALKPDYATAHSNLLFTLNYLPGRDPDTVFAEHVEFARQHETPLVGRIQPHRNDRSPGRRLKIGYVSGDFRSHAVAQFFEPVLAHHDHGQFEIYCYSCHHQTDEVTRRLQGHADRWRSLVGIADEAAAEMIRADEIDILVDLAGHTAYNRLPLFAAKPAPVQATYLGYLNTTGLRAMDYRITDAFADPEGLTEKYHTEQLMRLPDSFWCYRTPPDAPPVNSLPALQRRYVTFGSFNNFVKINHDVIAVWSRLLGAVPDSRLIMVGAPAGTAAHALRAQFEQAGVTPERLELLNKVSHEEFWRLHHRVDIALDPFPYTGGVTTCETLWMGVPVITLAGYGGFSGSGNSLLSNLGLREMIARTPEEYVAIGVALAQDLDRLRELRAGMRERIGKSPLTDAVGVTRHLEAAYRKMWAKYAGGQT